MISAGYDHSVILKSDGTVWSFGNNSDGQLGARNEMMEITYGEQDSENQMLVPKMIKGIDNIVAVSAGYKYTLALKSDGTVWSWGDHRSEVLGREVKLYGENSIPGQVTGLKDIVQISAGRDISGALDKDGSIWVWGKYYDLSESDYSVSLPVKIDGTTDIKLISAGAEAILALHEDGSIWAVGAYTGREIPYDYTEEHDKLKLVEVSTKQKLAKDIKTLDAGDYKSAILKSDGTVGVKVFMGTNGLGIIDNDITNHSSYKIMAELKDIIDVSSGYLYTGVLTSEGEVLILSQNMTARTGLKDIVAISSGGEHLLAIKKDGTVLGLGSNRYGELGDGTTIDRVQPVKVLLDFKK